MSGDSLRVLLIIMGSSLLACEEPGVQTPVIRGYKTLDVEPLNAGPARNEDELKRCLAAQTELHRSGGFPPVRLAHPRTKLRGIPRIASVGELESEGEALGAVRTASAEDTKERCFVNAFEMIRPAVLYDHATGLEWQQNGSPGLHREGAEVFVAGLNAGDQPGGWRLPTVPEAFSLVHGVLGATALQIDTRLFRLSEDIRCVFTSDFEKCDEDKCPIIVKLWLPKAWSEGRFSATFRREVKDWTKETCQVLAVRSRVLSIKER